LRRIKFFEERQDFELDMRDLCGKLKLERFHAMDDIIKFGDTGARKFYILVSGVV
jgi:hypothetical protein